MMRFNRRRFLSALGLGAAATSVPFWMRSASADDGDGPRRRLIVLSSAHGTVHQHWAMNPLGLPAADLWEFPLAGLVAEEFSRALAPLYRHRDRMNVIDGLSMSSAELDLPGYRHEKGWIHAWTGGWVHFTGSDLFSTLPSLDQLVARRIGRPDRLASIELAINEGRPTSHAGLAQQLPMAKSPQQVFDRIFGGAGSHPRDRSRGTVLDYAIAEHAALAPKLSAYDRQRMDQHFELVRGLEQRLTGLASLDCSASQPMSAEAYDANFRAMADLVGAAFACDATRVATLSLGDLASQDFGWGDYLSGDAHNDFAHRIYEDPRAALAMADYTRVHAEHVAWLIDVLSNIPEEGGGSIMDNTLIVWGGELGDGWHGYQHYCASTFGGSWAWDTGRYIHCPATISDIRVLTPAGMVRGGTPHSHLLVSVGRAMGLEQDYIGLREVETPEGVRVSLRGGLPGLT